jgi:hypothetical protein
VARRRVAEGVLVGGLVMATTAAAQYTITPDTGVPGPGGEKFNVAIVNQASSPVRFVLRPKAGQWADYTLAPSEKSIYSCYGCGGSFEITIRTAGTTVSYDITTGKVYAIRVNPTRNVFDVYELQ